MSISSVKSGFIVVVSSDLSHLIEISWNKCFWNYIVAIFQMIAPTSDSNRWSKLKTNFSCNNKFWEIPYN